MSHRLLARDLTPADRRVLRDLARFGAMADDQILRRYTDSAPAPDHLARLCAAGWVEELALSNLLHQTRVFRASPAGARVVAGGPRARPPRATQLAHDLALIDLADYLLRTHPTAEWRTEVEAWRWLYRPDPAPYAAGPLNTHRHRPDGLLLAHGECLAIELEHSDKGYMGYAQICRWYAATPRIDAVRWYVDSERIRTRIQQVNVEHGFDRDIDVTCVPFPPGVVMRPAAQLVHAGAYAADDRHDQPSAVVQPCGRQ